MIKNFLSTFLTRARNTAILGMATLLASPALAATEEAAHPTGQPYNWQMGFQPAVSPVKEQMEYFHNVLLMPIITGIVILVMLLLLYVMIRFNAKANPTPSKTTHNTLLEVIWTLGPVLILVAIVLPSMKLLYFGDRTADAEMTLKVTGYQWYWGYNYPDHGDIEFNAYLVKDDELGPGQVRLLSTDVPVVVPVDTNIRILVTANDVLHAWAMPSAGVKIDAVPGRTNETWMRLTKEGTYYGQCSELCGKDHGFMPIEVQAVSKEKFAEWVVAQGGKMPEVTAAADMEVVPVVEKKLIELQPAEMPAVEDATVEDTVADAPETDETSETAPQE